VGRKRRNCLADYRINYYIGGFLLTKVTKVEKLDVEEWKQLPWSEFMDSVYRLQCRIYKASLSGDEKKVYGLQRLLASSKGARYLAVRQVTQLNTGKRTAGVDNIKNLMPKDRILLAEDLKGIKNWKHSKLRRVFIPKPNGERRPLGIPTIRDRAAQCLVKYCLEPVYEASASGGSCGFRPGRSAHDIQKKIFTQLRSSSKGELKQILEIDIEKCFDRIGHDKLLSLIKICAPLKKFIRVALKAGVLDESVKTYEGTPQGGVISPLLANIALNGLEDIINEKRGTAREIQNGLRYADDMIFFLKEGVDPIKLRKDIDQFLEVRGLNINEVKTRLVKATDGFDFLGWKFKVAKKRFLSCPSKDSVKNMVSKIKTTMRDQKYSIKVRLGKVEVIYRGWFRYHRYCDLSEVNLWSIKKWTYKYIRTNTKMSSKEVVNSCRRIFDGHESSVNSHIAVKGKKSVYDGDLLYWSKRNDQRFTGPLARKLKQQNFKCNECSLYFLPEDPIELHHIDGNNQNFKSNNLEALHRACHHYKAIHSVERKAGKLSQ
jgi:RNA-directed DNA polymerase